jgi:predicted ATP-grasp superfamily ATP-dependent carboligase
LIAALSGRALAAAARAAGYRPLVADLFGDLDTQAIAEAHVRVPGSLASGPKHGALLNALDRLAEGRKPAGLVYGSGFERRPALLASIARRHELLGNSPAVIADVADPEKFAATCRRLGVPHPAILVGPAPGSGWLEKRAGGAGGAHIRAARPGALPRRGHYLQRRADGTPVSALFVANRQDSLVLGFSEQWAAPLPGRPFRYGGAVRPAMLAPTMATAMKAAIAKMAGEVGVIGLNSADFLVQPDGFDLLEINPRPGASLDVYTDADGTAFSLHIEACRGRLPPAAPAWHGAAAAAVVFVPRRRVLPGGFAWPDWASDRQPSGLPVAANGPFCTVRAEAETPQDARALVRHRAAAILELAGISG